MTPKESAQISVRELWNHADHLAGLVECARYAIEAGDFADAKDCLEKAHNPSGLVERYLRSTLERISEVERE